MYFFFLVQNVFDLAGKYENAESIKARRPNRLLLLLAAPNPAGKEKKRNGNTHTHTKKQTAATTWKDHMASRMARTFCGFSKQTGTRSGDGDCRL